MHGVRAGRKGVRHGGFRHGKIRKQWLGRLLTGLVPLILPGMAMAQQAVDPRMEEDTAATRPRPEYDQPGLQAGNFLIFPTLAADLAISDNIYARRDIRVGDEVFSVRPTVWARSRWQRHEFNLHANGQVDRYVSHAGENNETWATGFDGRIDIGKETELHGNLNFAHNIEPRGSTGDTLFGAAPVAYGLLTADLRVDQAFYHTRVTVAGHLDRFRYSPRVLNDTPIDLSYRDYDYLEGRVRVAQGVSPGMAAYAEFSIASSTYTFNLQGSGQRDATQYSGLVGVAFGLNRLIHGEAGIGYFRRDFKDPAYRGTQGLNYNVSLAWSPTRLTTVNLVAARTFQRAPMMGVAGIEEQGFTVTVVHELLRNLLLKPGGGYTRDSYQGADRHDTYANGQFGATWLVDRHWQVDANFTYRIGRNSDPAVAARQFDQSRGNVTLSYRF
ncbi:hypothetical protein Y88_1106 [Novosphingobium nitrogenifigens DSM 19370]|uniref:Outer membrane beta-barrel protein n=1 Tax=Novosphingobium nitrogenifigens DSM 19370 TaxID=983920 RepID=F1Z8I0_9SPHN|nr:outer membrane beta-barrel protein [Novosphingobium nitrogenifigens]EGD59044.1 hypothetical protein Y88_1106 [Novosphingobium nitrogenifigens DSM 19370]